MGAPELLHHLRGAGLVLTLTPAGGLHVAPRTALNDDHRAVIRAERDALVLALRAEVQCEAFEEWAAIMEFDGGLTRSEAEAAAGELLAAGEVSARVARAMQLGFEQQMAEALAERLRERDDHADYRHLCIECRHYRPGRCGNHRAADLATAEVGRDLATMLQHCAGFEGGS